MGTHPIFESDFDCLTEMKHLILLAGGSCAGKTTLAKQLEKEYGIRHVWCDGFYFSDEIIFSRGLTWDDTASIDWISVHRAVEEAFEKSEIVILDGMMVLDGILGIYEALSFTGDSYKNTGSIKMFWLQVDKKVAAIRRNGRKDFQTEEPKGYFEDKVWPEVVKREERAKVHGQIEVIS